MIDEEIAIKVGKKFGLRLTDIHALSRLASSPEHAEELARDFGGKTEDDEAAEIVAKIPRDV